MIGAIRTRLLFTLLAVSRLLLGRKLRLRVSLAAKSAVLDDETKESGR